MADRTPALEVRVAIHADLAEICEFGATNIPPHYGPLLGTESARAQVDNWWHLERMSRAVEEGRVVVAEERGMVLGVGEWSLYEGTPVIWKLYVHPQYRGEGIGQRLIDVILREVPAEADRVRVETFAVNRRAVAFYEREGFTQKGTVEHQTDPRMNVVWLERSLDD